MNVEALEQAPAFTGGDSVGLTGANVLFLPTPTPRGVFRPGAGGGFQ